jgi:hypothetical protein
MNILTSRSSMALFLVVAFGAAIAPLLQRGRTSESQAGSSFPGWPTHYAGRTLTELPLSSREAGFVQDFPGRIGRFSDGRRELIVRWVNAPTRRLHSAADCFRGIGFTIKPSTVQKDPNGVTMGCFRATNGREDLAVCEVIRDERGESWPDVSAWYWHALFGNSRAPWWSYVIAEPATTHLARPSP